MQCTMTLELFLLGLLLSPYVSCDISQHGYEDPHSLYYRKQFKVKGDGDQAPTNDIQVGHNRIYAITHNDLENMFKPTDNYCDGEDCTNPYATFCRRLVNLLLLNSNLRGDGQAHFGKLNFHITEEESSILKAFGNGARISIAEIDEILQSSILPANTSIYDTAFYWVDSSFIFFYKHRVIFGSLLLLGLILLLAFKVKWNFIRIVLLLLYLAFIATYFMTWWELMQKAEAEQLANQKVYSDMPAECKQNEINFIDSVKLFFGIGKGECYKFMEAQLAQTELKITPVYVFIEVCSKSIMQPLSMLGREVSTFASQITGRLPVPLNWITEVILIILIPIICLMIYFVWMGGSIAFNFPFCSFHLKPSEKAQCISCDSKTNGRQAIEVVKQVYKVIETEKEEVKRIDGKVDVALDPIENNSDDFEDLIDSFEEQEIEEMQKLQESKSGKHHKSTSMSLKKY